MKLLKILLIPFIIISVSIASCTDDDLVKTGGGSTLIIDPTITQTDQFGNVLGGDTTDWCSNSNTLFRFYPAYPNPANDTVKLRFQDPEQDTISILYLKSNGDTAYHVRDLVINPGVYEVSFNAREHLFYSGVMRFLIRSKRFPDGGNFCRYYGDVQFY